MKVNRHSINWAAIIIMIIGIRVFATTPMSLVFLVLLFLPYVNLISRDRLNFLYFLVLFKSRFFSILPQKIYGFQISRLFTVFILVYFVVLLTKKRMRRRAIQKKYLNFIPFIILVICTCCLAGYLKIRQSLFLSVVTQTELINLLLMIFLFSREKYSESEFCRIKDFIYHSSILNAILIFSQYLLLGKIDFMADLFVSTRSGNRMVASYGLMPFALIIAVENLIKKINVKNIVSTILFAFVMIFVLQTRMVLFGTVLACLVMFFNTSKSNFRNKVMISILVLLAVPLFYQQIEQLLGYSLNDISSGTFGFRLDEITFYTQQVEYPIIGRGYLTDKNISNAVFTTKYNFYDISDIGIFGYYTVYGILGVTLIVFIYLYTLNNARRSINRVFVYSMATYCIFTSFTLWDFSSFLYISIMILGVSCQKNNENCSFQITNKNYQ